MASEDQVRTYLACWFQLGKAIIIQPDGLVLNPQPIVQGDRYSPEFETCWQTLQQVSHHSCYLEGTNQTLAELLSGYWDIVQCARCTLPIPLPYGNIIDLSCPCNDLSTWPNDTLPIPRPPIELQQQLQRIQRRIQEASQRYQNHNDL
jgi:hypothetical protein